MSRSSDALDTINDRNVVKILDASVIGMMDSESNHRVYQECGSLIPRILSRTFVEQDYRQAVHAVTMLRRHSTEPTKGFGKRP